MLFLSPSCSHLGFVFLFFFCKCISLFFAFRSFVQTDGWKCCMRCCVWAPDGVFDILALDSYLLSSFFLFELYVQAWQLTTQRIISVDGRHCTEEIGEKTHKFTVMLFFCLASHFTHFLNKSDHVWRIILSKTWFHFVPKQTSFSVQNENYRGFWSNFWEKCWELFKAQTLKKNYFRV